MTTEVKEKEKRNPDLWLDPYAKKRSEENQAYATFVHNCMGYRVSKTGMTFCVGKVLRGQNDTSVVVPDPHQTTPEGQKGVTKPMDKGIIPPSKKQIEVLLQKNKGGRPKKKTGEKVSRMTKWRRKKERQLVLV